MNFKEACEIVYAGRQLADELDDHDRWIREVLTDFKIEFDDHKIGRRLALTQWMADAKEKAGK